jgi:hypothetical protein
VIAGECENAGGKAFLVAGGKAFPSSENALADISFLYYVDAFAALREFSCLIHFFSSSYHELKLKCWSWMTVLVMDERVRQE